MKVGKRPITKEKSKVVVKKLKPFSIIVIHVARKSLKRQR